MALRLVKTVPVGFKDVETAKRDVNTLEQSYRYFSNAQDRAGQHHTLEMFKLIENSRAKCRSEK
jgi:hypothetical protein